MPGPPPKHPSIRARRNKTGSAGDFRVLAIAPDIQVPPWPLAADVSSTALLEVTRDRVASFQVELEGCEDGRARGRIQRRLAEAELQVAQLSLEIEQASDAEIQLWSELWAMPQAVIWAESHAHRELAQYCRWKIRAEGGNLDAGKEARMLSDRLGLNPLALLRLRAEIEQVQKAQEDGVKRREAAAKKVPAKKKKAADPRGFLSDAS